MNRNVLIAIFLIIFSNSHGQQDSTAIQNALIGKSKGSWKSPIKRYSAIIKSYFVDPHLGIQIQDSGLIFVSDSAFEVKAPISGRILTNHQELYYSIAIVSGDYMLTIWGLEKPFLNTGDFVIKGQSIALIARSTENQEYRIMISLVKDREELDLRKWFSIKFSN
jgi:hypothetical protein